MPDLIGLFNIPAYDTDESVPTPLSAYHCYLFARADGLYIKLANGTVVAVAAGEGGSISVAESDDDPVLTGITKITFPPGTVTTGEAGEAVLALSPDTHDHDLDYATASHDHDSDYAATGHNHDLAYAAAGHDHDLTYSPIGHDHDSDYAAALHGHGLDYAAYEHTHDYADADHNHDTVYLQQDDVRQICTTAVTYYVRTDGNDSNTGLADSAGGAFLTVQKAVNTVASLDTQGYTITIQIKDGTYNENVSLANVVGHKVAGDLVIQGNSGTPANVVINGSSNACFSAEGISSTWQIKNLKLTGANCHGIYASLGSQIQINNINFGAITGSYYAHISERGGYIYILGNYTISGACYRHVNVAAGGLINCQGITVTFTASCAFTQFAYAGIGGIMIINGNTYSTGAYSITGTRYSCIQNAVLWTNGGGANYFPGDVAGSTATGGQYI